MVSHETQETCSCDVIQGPSTLGVTFVSVSTFYLVNIFRLFSFFLFFVLFNIVVQKSYLQKEMVVEEFLLFLNAKYGFARSLCMLIFINGLEKHFIELLDSKDKL